MQEHRSKRTSKPRFRDRNYALTGSASDSVTGLTSSIVGGEDFSFAYLREEYLAKFCDESLVPASKRRSNAVEKWLKVEQANRCTNMRLTMRPMEYNILPRVTMGSFLRFARRLIRDILGPLTDKVVVGEFSGGASTSRRRTMSLKAQKYFGKADITEEAWKFLDILYREAPLLRQYAALSSFREVPGNVLFTVAKKTDIDRCACKEPDVNMFLQKGVGLHIRRRLAKHGVRLNDQSVNRRLSFEASVFAGLATEGFDDEPPSVSPFYGETRGVVLSGDRPSYGNYHRDLATIDLSSASDTVTRTCVRLLLPDTWFRYLDDIRSHVTSVPGMGEQRLEMFSSMGNGFTFELESLLFYALMRTTAYFRGHSGAISVYGDDLIIPRGMYDDAEWILREFGFTVNPDKSFHDGLFRESCGGHYYGGMDVTPFYLKKKARRLTDVIRVANQLRRWSLAEPSRQYQANLYEVWCSLAAMVPSKFWGGYDLSLDTQLVSPPTRDSGWRLVRLKEKRKDVPPEGLYMAWHNTNCDRTTPGEGGEDPVSTYQKCRARRAPQGAPVCQDWFHEELVQWAGIRA